jgi:prepilin-type N-terminal cleavage/methylation domain-containing protein
MKNKEGFTLVEVMVAIAIVSILAGAILTSMKGYGAKARGAKLAGSLNSVIAIMKSCRSFANGDVLLPSPGNNICSLGSSQTSSADQYGKWPDLSQIGSDYSYINDTDNNNCATDNCKLGFLPRNEPKKSYTSDSGFFVKKAEAGVSIPASTSGCFPKSGWYFAAGSVSDSMKFCCSSAMNGCKVISTGTNCDSSIN